jgi:hypothetical protein
VLRLAGIYEYGDIIFQKGKFNLAKIDGLDHRKYTYVVGHSLGAERHLSFDFGPRVGDSQKVYTFYHVA